MGRGFLSGVISGGLVGTLVFALLSLFSPLPQRAVEEATTPVEQEEAVSNEDEAETEEEAEADVAPESEPEAEPEVEAEPDAAQDPVEEPAEEPTEAPADEAPTEAQDPAAPESSDESSLQETGDVINDTADASAQSEDVAEDVQEATDDLAARLAARLAADAEEATEILDGTPVSVADGEPDLPQSPQETTPPTLAETLAELAPAPETLDPIAPAAPEPASRSVDVSVFSAPAPASDEAEAAGTDPGFGLPNVLNFDGQAPSFDGPVPQPSLDLALSSEARNRQPATPVQPNEAISEAPVADIAPTPTPDPVQQVEQEPSSEDEIINEVVARINQSEAVVSSRLPQTTDDLTEVGASSQQPLADDDSGTNRLPTLVDELNANAAGDEQAEPPAKTQLDPSEVGALRAFAAPAPQPTDLPKIAVILIDAGDLGVASSELISQPFPMTLAVRTGMSNGQSKVRTYRTAGFEVLTMPDDLPRLADPSDVQVALAGYFSRYKETIGVLDPLDRRIQLNRALLGPVLDGMKIGGFGFVSYQQGLNSAQQEAERQKVPAASVFRVLDAELEDGDKIQRYLDRAAFTASQEGHAVVLGHSYRETVDAISAWAKENAFEYTLVPVSTILLDQANG